MQTNIFTINWDNVKSGLVSGLLMAFLGIAGYVIALGDIFLIDARALINIGVMAFLTTIVSLIKAFLTNRSGEFVGAVKVINEDQK